MRKGRYDVLVGINLLREGLDIPEVSLITILDADKEGFLRSETSLIQTIGRAARNAEGKVIMYADRITDSMKRAIDETNRRREIQDAYNIEHNITPKTIYKDLQDSLSIIYEGNDVFENSEAIDYKELSVLEKEELIKKLEKEMKDAAKKLDFKQAMSLRDLIYEIKSS